MHTWVNRLIEIDTLSHLWITGAERNWVSIFAKFPSITPWTSVCHQNRYLFHSILFYLSLSISRFVCDCPPELKFNVDAIDILIRSHLLNMREFDLHLVQVRHFVFYHYWQWSSAFIHVITPYAWRFAGVRGYARDEGPERYFWYVIRATHWCPISFRPVFPLLCSSPQAPQ